MGTSIVGGIKDFVSKDHPHAYGDKQGSISPSNDFIGSSPRVWGQVFVRRLQIFLLRIIPTRMGTSFCPSVANFPFEDHPHAYGDKLLQDGIFHFPKGSSPRVWGQGENYVRF